MKKRLIFGILGAVFLALLAWRIILLVTKDEADSSRAFARPPVAVEVDTVRHESIQETLQLTGTIYPLYQYIIAPKVSGRIIRINKRIGDWVRKGEIIAQIDDAEYQQAVLEAEANLKISQANLTEIGIQQDLARQEQERIQSLQQKGIASPAELDAVNSNFSALQSRIKLAQAQVEQREAALSSAKIRLSYTVLLASEPGFIGERFIDEGSLLAPNSPVVSVLGIETVIVRTTVIERVYGQIKIGQAAEIAVDAFPDRAFYGKVSRIAPMLQEASRVAQMEVGVANQDLFLKPGMFTKVIIVLAESQNAQVIPSPALVNRNAVNGVFVIRKDETVAHFVPVQTGIGTLDKTEITSPEIDGVVVTLGQHLLEDNGNVILPRRQ